MKKLWLGSLLVLVVVFVAGVAMAQMDPGPFHILNNQGAIYNSDTGWNLSTPPYYAGSDWAVDFVYNSQGISILHKDGAVWNSDTGWNLNTPPYYAGTAYATALEYLRDLTGCWGLQMTDFETYYEETIDNYALDEDLIKYPDAYIEIEWQTGTRFGGKIVQYWDECEEKPFEGTIIGDHFTAVAQCVDEQDTLDIITGLVCWNDVDERWELKGSVVGADLEYYGGDELLWGASFGAFIAWPETSCVCPPE